MRLRGRRQLLGLGCHTVLAALCLAGIAVGRRSEDATTANFWTAMCVVYLLTLRLNPLPAWVQRWVIRRAHCSQCGAAFDLVNNWRCGCGFVTWRSRHAFGPCPQCGKGFRWLVCPGCGASILV